VKEHALISATYFSDGEVRAPACFTVEPLWLHGIHLNLVTRKDKWGTIPFYLNLGTGNSNMMPYYLDFDMLR
jgi:hypothetical protein